MKKVLRIFLRIENLLLPFTHKTKKKIPNLIRPYVKQIKTAMAATAAGVVMGVRVKLTMMRMMLWRRIILGSHAGDDGAGEVIRKSCEWLSFSLFFRLVFYFFSFQWTLKCYRLLSLLLASVVVIALLLWHCISRTL